MVILKYAGTTEQHEQNESTRDKCEYWIKHPI